MASVGAGLRNTLTSVTVVDGSRGCLRLQETWKCGLSGAGGNAE